MLPPFDAWASDPAQGLTAGVNDGPMADPDRDGISNLMEFALGGAPMVSSRTILPTLTRSGNNWLFEYNRSDLSLSPATTQVVEYGSDLAGWTTVTIPTTSAGIVTIAPGSPSDHVTVTIASPSQGLRAPQGHEVARDRGPHFERRGDIHAGRSRGGPYQFQRHAVLGTLTNDAS